VAKTFPDFFEALFAVATAVPEDVPVITIDGPTASGKGTLAAAVAAALGWHLLDSGALYRATGLAAQWDGVSPDDEAAVARLAGALDLHFDGGRTWLRGRDVSDTLRLESTAGVPTFEQTDFATPSGSIPCRKRTRRASTPTTRRPSRCGRSERRTVSTSGSSGTAPEGSTGPVRTR